LVHKNGKSALFEPDASNSQVTVDDGLSQKILTMAGAGISANADWSVDPELQSGRLIRVLPDYTVEDDSAVWLLYPKSYVLTSKVRVFIDFLMSKLGSTTVG